MAYEACMRDNYNHTFAFAIKSKPDQAAYSWSPSLIKHLWYSLPCTVRLDPPHCYLYVWWVHLILSLSQLLAI